LRAILDYLKLKRIFHLRLNTGATIGEYHGKKRMFRFGSPGCPDILAVPDQSIMWIEAKSSTGKQSELQKEWQKDVEKRGHTYILARSVGDVMAFFEKPQ
jgi:hypothetical protein